MIEKEELFTVLPHRGRMLLLSRVTEYNLWEQWLRAEYDITGDCQFYDPAAGVPAWVGFECIAQAVSALVGIRIRENGEPPRIGFILSVSAMKVRRDFIAGGSTAEIKIQEIGRMDSVYTFEGSVSVKGDNVLEGKITVMDADDDYVKTMTGERISIE